ncbi:MAG: hypothetical protein HGGPFJEG_01182 [Ignavibacteria bacterium]|nr:hypothetical protein [Ignavibacteria bacterium]
MKKTITTLALGISIFAMTFTILNAQTYFSDDFENGLSNWIVGGNNWDTLSTTYTSSNHCVTDSRVGNYSYNSDPTIVMSPSLNLSNASYPVLTFFHRYNLVVTSCGTGTTYDYIYLEVSTNGGFNWSQLKVWNGTNRAWYYEQVNLKSYRSNLVKFRFRLSSHNACSSIADGWYIDDVKVVEYNTLNPHINFPFNDNFENGLSKWIVGGFNWDTTSTTSSSGLRSVTESRTGNYLHSSGPTLTLYGVLNLSGTSFPVLTFSHRRNLVVTSCGTGTTYDYVYLQISTDGGFNWNQITPPWQGTNNAWFHEQFNLSNYRTDSVKIRFHLSSYNVCGATADGWFIDDVTIREFMTGVTIINSSTPDKYALNQNYPNPFNPTTNIKFAIPKKSFVRLLIYDLLGKEVATLVNEELNAGSYQADWNASGYPSGVYFYRIQEDDFVQTRSMVLVK